MDECGTDGEGAVGFLDEEAAGYGAKLEGGIGERGGSFENAEILPASAESIERGGGVVGGDDHFEEDIFGAEAGSGGFVDGRGDGDDAAVGGEGIASDCIGDGAEGRGGGGCATGVSVLDDDGGGGCGGEGGELAGEGEGGGGVVDVVVGKFLAVELSGLGDAGAQE